MMKYLSLNFHDNKSFYFAKANGNNNINSCYNHHCWLLLFTATHLLSKFLLLTDYLRGVVVAAAIGTPQKNQKKNPTFILI
jgi:hypothetical protein